MRLPANRASATSTTKTTAARTNIIFAIPAVAVETPEKLNKPATRETMKQMKASLSTMLPSRRFVDTEHAGLSTLEATLTGAEPAVRRNPRPVAIT